MQNSPDAGTTGGAKVRDIKGSDLSHDAAQFREKLSALEKDLRDLTKISRAMASDTVGMLKDSAGEYYQQGVKRAKGMERDLEARIKAHPLQSLLIALGVGWLFGLFFRRH